MISAPAADKIINAALPRYAPVRVALKEACGRILQEDIRADRNSPPFKKALMDGIAVAYTDWKKGKRVFQIKGICQAGKPRSITVNGGCVEIMTGAVVPDECSVIIPVEHISITGKKATVASGYDTGLNQNIRVTGSDHKKGAVLLRKGTLLNGVTISIAASVGKTHLRVNPLINTAIIATGDELVDIGRPVKFFQTRLSNSYMLDAALTATKMFKTTMVHVKDNKVSIERAIKKALEESDVVVLTGGVSKGKFDFVPAVLKSLSVHPQFERVRQKPGKPFWFGTKGSKKIVFALPGNPLSTIMVCFRFLIPSFKRNFGQLDKGRSARLQEVISGTPGLTRYIPARFSTDRNGVLWARLIRTGGSGNLGSIGDSEGFVELPEGSSKFCKGDVVQYYEW